MSSSKSRLGRGLGGLISGAGNASGKQAANPDKTSASSGQGKVAKSVARKVPVKKAGTPSDALPNAPGYS